MIPERKKKFFRSIHGGSLSLCKCWQARIKATAGRIWPVGSILPMSVLEDGCAITCCLKMLQQCCQKGFDGRSY